MKKLFTILGLAFALSVNAQVTISPSATAICQGDSVTLIAQVTGASADTLNFTWFLNGSPISVPNNDTITVTIGGNYSVNVLTNQSLLIGNDNQGITVNSNPVAIAGSNSPVCAGQTIQFNTGAGMSSYQWGGPNGFSSSLQNPTIPNANATMWADYGLIVTDANGCTDSVTFNVVVNPLPIASITVSPNDTVCQAVPVTLTGIGGVSYLWNNTQTTQAITQTLTTVGNTPFSVNVTGANGCSSMANQTIVVRPNPLAIATGTNASCNGANDGSATVNAFFGSPFTYIWDTNSTNDSITGLSPAIYSVTVTNVYGCSATDTATVGQPTVLTAAISGQTNVNCNGDNNGTANVTPTGGTAPYSYSWTGSGVGTNPRTGLTASSYTVTVMDANLCTTTATVTITEPQVLTANADSTSVTCFGDNDGTAWVIPLGGTPPYSYVWSNNATTQFVSSLTAGTYSVTVTDDNGCTVSAATAVTEPNPITFSPITSNALCNGGNGTIAFTNVNGGTAPYTYSINGGNTYGPTSTFNVPFGTYQLSVLDANNCSIVNVPTSITEPPVMQLTVTDTNAVCGGLGMATVTISGGTAPFDYDWSNGDSTNVMDAGPGTYTVTVTDMNGCMATGSANIGQPIIPTITGTVTDVTCFSFSNGVVDMTPSGVGPFIYNWSNGSTAQDLTNVGAGIYTIIVTGANNCINTNQFIVYQPAVLTATAPSDTVACNGTLGSLTVAPVGGTTPYTYSWNTVPVQTGITVTNLTAGVAYTVIVTDANGCTTQATGSVTQPSALTVNVIPQDINCTGNNGSATATVSGGTPFPGGSYTFVWSNGSQLNQAFGLSFGNHSVTVTDANGCSSTQQFTINPGNAFALSLQATDGCQGQSGGILLASATGGSGNFSYVWGNGATGNSFTALTSGTYTVTVTDLGSQCSQDQSIQVQVNPAIHVTLPANMTVCSGNTTLVYANVSGGTLPSNFAYQWQLPTGQSQTGVGPTGVNPVVTGNYTLTVSEGNCSGSATVFVNVSPIAEPIAAFGYVQNNPYNYTFTSSSVNTSSLIWIINNQMAGSGQQFTYNFPVTGFYDVKLVASNECGSDTTSQLIGIGVTGISESDLESVELFPNPISSGQHLTVQLPFTIQEVHVRIVDFVGKTVFQGRTNEEEFQIPTSGLAAGTYMVQIATADRSVSLRKKLVVQ
jgi:hypothetical protein